MTKEQEIVRIGIVGFGYWGPNLVRNFTNAAKSEVLAICEALPERLDKARRLFPSALATDSFEDLLNDPAIDLIAIATPVSSHYALAKAALEHGKHVLVEKPLADTSARARELLDLSYAVGRHLFVDHTFLFTPAVQKIKTLIDERQLGDLMYYDSTRINLGLFQHDIDVVWDLLPHDLSILDYLLDGKMPERIACWGTNHFSDFADLAYVTLTYANNFIAHVHVNWLAPVKMRQVLICGDKKMAVYDENTVFEKLRIYDRGVRVRNREDVYKRLVQYREGDMTAPSLDNSEPLANEVENIIETLLGNQSPVAGPELGCRITALLEAASASLENQGMPIDVSEFLANDHARRSRQVVHD